MTALHKEFLFFILFCTFLLRYSDFSIVTYFAFFMIYTTGNYILFLLLCCDDADSSISPFLLFFFLAA